MVYVQVTKVWDCVVSGKEFRLEVISTWSNELFKGKVAYEQGFERIVRISSGV